MHIGRTQLGVELISSQIDLPFAVPLAPAIEPAAA
jgi:hypothetical protein